MQKCSCWLVEQKQTKFMLPALMCATGTRPCEAAFCATYLLAYSSCHTVVVYADSLRAPSPVHVLYGTVPVSQIVQS